ncbi:uncharacterized protein LOC126381229 [Pectinophora gossypiella]|uniref:uncharacterized protein LOC126381229 n=1 Tax=Pectinophora gossypiella TaxID=13191 RepID=UPI00214EF174|nr:uncharacterized protein LOC126381229 [Pectinophora gossypiella]
MSIGRVSEFDVKTGVWSSYVDRLDMYFTANDVKSDRKLPTLIAVMGDEAYELLVNLSSPSKPSELGYEKAVELLQQHLQPAPSALAERFKFRQRRQGAEESVSCYVAELKKLARFCKFDKNLSENLRDQFVCGLRSDIIRQRLFAEDDALTYNNAVKMATSLEAAERNAAIVDAAGTASVGGDIAVRAGDLHAIAVAGGRRRPAAGGGGGGRGGARAQRGARGGGARAGSAGASAPGRKTYHGSIRPCTGCGSTNHGYESCRFREYECSRCRRRGHLRRVCPERSPAEAAGYGKERTLYYADMDDVLEGQGTLEEEEKFHHLCLNDYRAVDEYQLGYKELFDGGLGRYTGGKATLRVRDGAAPVFHRARPLPYALRDRVDAELDSMLRDGVIEPVDCSDWASPLVPPHMGIVKSKAMARSYVWWAGLDEAVERMCRACELCAAQADAPPRQAPCMWPWPNRAWSRLHLDFMGPIFVA